MGILEVHFHDSRFEWTFNPETGGEERSLSLGVGSESEPTPTDDGESRPAVASKLRSLAILALVVGGAVAYNRMQSRRAAEVAEAEAESTGRRLSLSRSR
jgi:hypothetical protein